MKVLIAALVAAFFVPDVQAQNIMPPGACKTRSEVIEFLRKEHQESLGLTLLSKQGHIIEFFADVDDGSWTIIKVPPKGCVAHLDSGDFFEWREAIYGPAT